jgi:hypothetical protein
MICYLPWVLLFPLLGGEMCLLTVNDPLPRVLPSFTVYIAAFFLTFLIETVVMMIIWRRSSRKLALAVLLANVSTHPFAVFIWLPKAAALHLSARWTIIGAELVIPLVESLIYKRILSGSFVKSVISSIIANFFSWSLIAILQVLFYRFF